MAALEDAWEQRYYEEHGDFWMRKYFHESTPDAPLGPPTSDD